MSRRRASADVNSQPQPHLPSLMALMEAKVSHGNKQALRHKRGETCGGEDVDGDLVKRLLAFLCSREEGK